MSHMQVVFSYDNGAEELWQMGTLVFIRVILGVSMVSFLYYFFILTHFKSHASINTLLVSTDLSQQTVNISVFVNKNNCVCDICQFCFTSFTCLYFLLIACSMWIVLWYKRILCWNIAERFLDEVRKFKFLLIGNKKIDLYKPRSILYYIDSFIYSWPFLDK